MRPFGREGRPVEGSFSPTRTIGEPDGCRLLIRRPTSFTVDERLPRAAFFGDQAFQDILLAAF